MKKALVVAILSVYAISATGCCGRVCRNAFRKGAYCSTATAATATPAYMAAPSQMVTTTATPSTCTTCGPVVAAPAPCACTPPVETGCGTVGTIPGGYYMAPGAMSGVITEGIPIESGSWVPGCSSGECGSNYIAPGGTIEATEDPGPGA